MEWNEFGRAKKRVGWAWDWGRGIQWKILKPRILQDRSIGTTRTRIQTRREDTSWKGGFFAFGDSSHHFHDESQRRNRINTKKVDAKSDSTNRIRIPIHLLTQMAKIDLHRLPSSTPTANQKRPFQIRPMQKSITQITHGPCVLFRVICVETTRTTQYRTSTFGSLLKYLSQKSHFYFHLLLVSCRLIVLDALFLLGVCDESGFQRTNSNETKFMMAFEQ